jgi:cytochrome c oxidase subunit 2
MEQIPGSILTLAAGIIITLVSLWVSQQYHLLFPEQASTVAPLVDNFFGIMLGIAMAFFFVVQGAIIYFMIRYRQSPGDEEDGVPVRENLPLEAFWTAVPAIIVIFLGIYSVDIFQRMGGFNPGDHAGHAMIGHKHAAAIVAQAPEMTMTSDTPMLLAQAEQPEVGFGASPDKVGKAPDLSVDVAGMQYAWIFTYPDTGIISGELHIPVDQDVQLNISAKDVIHSFWVPQFRLKQDAIPGIPTELRFVATKPGAYPVVCAELCGGYHGSMRTRVIVHTPEDYQQWVSQNTVAQAPNSAPTLLARAYPIAPDNAMVAGHIHHMGVTPETLANYIPSV